MSSFAAAYRAHVAKSRRWGGVDSPKKPEISASKLKTHLERWKKTWSKK